MLILITENIKVFTFEWLEQGRERIAKENNLLVVACLTNRDGEDHFIPTLYFTGLE